jgi:hypothetical protein
MMWFVTVNIGAKFVGVQVAFVGFVQLFLVVKLVGKKFI